jgi:RNA polymerase sigma-70 factor (ECF subfamily)
VTDDAQGARSSAEEAILQAALAEARARWPGVRLTDADFRAHLARLGGEPSALDLEDLFLACACAAGDRAGLQVLEQTVLSQVPRWVARFDGLDADEIKQDLRQKLLLGEGAHLRLYAGRGALDRWVRVAALRLAIDRRRAEKPADPDALDDLLAGPDPELDFVKLRDREALRHILQDALRALPARDVNLLRLHYAESVSLDRLAGLEHVSRSTVARRLVAARAAALDGVRALLRERLRLTAHEGESLMRLVRSRLELSLRRALASTDPPISPVKPAT